MFLFTALAVALEVEFPDPTGPGLDSQFGDLPVDPLGVTAAMSGMSVVMTLLVLAGIGIGIWRFSITTKASKDLGLGGAGTFLALTDENATTAFLAGAAVKASSQHTGQAPVQDVSSRLEGLQRALDKGLISDEEFAAKRAQILHDA
jgi:hypothetical protein